MRVFGEAEPLGGFLHQASPDLRVVVRRGHNSSLALSHQRAGSSTVPAGGTGHTSRRQDHGLGACGPGNCGRLGRGVDQRLA